MGKKFGLGKGLEALIPNEIEEDTNNKLEIDINSIVSNIEQPRKRFDEDKIVELSESIKQHGLIQPIIVVEKQTDTYEIVAGERRWRACKLAGLEKVPVVIMELTKREILEVSLIENIQRQDLNPIEEAKAYKKLLTDFNITQDQLSRRIGKSRTAIANCLRLLNLEEIVQNYLIDGVISEGHGRAILTPKDNSIQGKVAQMILDENLSVRETENLVRRLNSKKIQRRVESKKENHYYKDLKNRLENFFQTKVNINNKKNKGKIEIEYYSDEDLQRILDMLNLE